MMAEMSKKNQQQIALKSNKKSKNDYLRAAIGVYLKQKCYSTNEKLRRSDLALHHNKKQFVFQKMLQSDETDINSFTYTNVVCLSNNNHHIIDQQYARFTQFIESQADAVRVELRRFYAPMMCHFYIELLKAREHKVATDFVRKYAHLVSSLDLYSNNGNVTNGPLTNEFNSDLSFMRELSIEDPEAEYFCKLMQTLLSYTSLDGLEQETAGMRFRSGKYEMHTTQAAVDALSGYLEKCGHVLILQVINTWFDIHIVDSEIRQWTEDYLFAGQRDEEELLNESRHETKPIVMPRAGTKRNSSSSNSSEATKTSPNNIKMEQLQTESVEEQEQRHRQRKETVRNCLQVMRETRGELLKTQMEFPHFFKLADKGRGLTCAHIDANECHIVAGFNNSIINIWPLNQQTRRGKQLYRRRTDLECPWDINNCNFWNGSADMTEHEDEIECDIREHNRIPSKEEQRKRKQFEEAKYEDNSCNDFGGVQLIGHNLGVTDIRFSAHYPLLYSSSKDSTWRSWRADNYSTAMVYRGHRYPIWCLDESPVGNYLATGSKDMTARLWSLERKYPLVTFCGHTQDIDCIAYHPNGNYLATGSTDLSVRLWCASSGRLLRVFHDCKQQVTAIAFSPDGKFLAAGGEDPKVRIFDLAAGAQLSELKDHTASVTSIAWSSCGREVASVCRDGSLRLWDVKKLAPLNISDSSVSSSASSSVHRLMAMTSNCQSLVKVLYSRSETICCIGM